MEVFPIAHKVKSSLAIFELEDLKNCVICIEEYSRDQVKLDAIPALYTKFKTEGQVAVLNLKVELQRLKKLNA
jgi:hypothetical protein